MRIRYVGAGERLMLGYRWDEGNGRVVEVTGAMDAAECLAYARGGFVVDVGEPLLEIAGSEEWVFELAMAGVGTVADLAGLDEAGVRRVAREVGVSVRVVRGWRREARPLRQAQGEQDQGEQDQDEMSGEPQAPVRIETEFYGGES